jgi:hypothetical protein
MDDHVVKKKAEADGLSTMQMLCHIKANMENVHLRIDELRDRVIQMQGTTHDTQAVLLKLGRKLRKRAGYWR